MFQIIKEIKSHETFNTITLSKKWFREFDIIYKVEFLEESFERTF